MASEAEKPKGKPKEPPVRIVVKHGDHGGHHGGAWKVAYADFVTAMMALFIVLWIVGQSKQAKDSVAQYFQDPTAFFENVRSGKPLHGGGGIPKSSQPGDTATTEKQKMLQMADTIRKSLSGISGLRQMLDQVNIEITVEGLRIEMRDTKVSAFFDIGTTKLKGEARQILLAIAKNLKEIPNKIVLEGHTDSRPYATEGGYTNFELSAERANSARRVLIEGGVKLSQISQVRGYADTKLKNRDDPHDVSNRRISIIIKYESGQSE